MTKLTDTTALTLFQKQDYKGAIKVALAVLEKTPNDPHWLNNLGVFYRFDNQMQNSFSALARAVEIAPDNVEFTLNLGMILADLGERDQANRFILKALYADPANQNIHSALCDNLMHRGEFLPAWRSFDRVITQEDQTKFPLPAEASWNGMDVHGGSILVVTDQGAGDIIQFARYLPMVAERCDGVIVSTSKALQPILSSIRGVTKCILHDEPAPPCAAGCRISQLPGIFGTTLSTIPIGMNYIHAEPCEITKWSLHLPRVPGYKVGLCWRGNKFHMKNHWRSISEADMGLLFDAVHGRNPSFISLTMPFPQEAFGFPVFDAAPLLHDYGDTAACIANLDLVISVDTSVAHLAAAMGKETWIMLPKAADWRWYQHKAGRSPWYPTMRIFQQEDFGDWASVVERIKGALKHRLLPITFEEG